MCTSATGNSRHPHSISLSISLPSTHARAHARTINQSRGDHLTLANCGHRQLCHFCEMLAYPGERRNRFSLRRRLLLHGRAPWFAFFGSRAFLFSAKIGNAPSASSSTAGTAITGTTADCWVPIATMERLDVSAAIAAAPTAIQIRPSGNLVADHAVQERNSG